MATDNKVNEAWLPGPGQNQQAKPKRPGHARAIGHIPAAATATATAPAASSIYSPVPISWSLFYFESRPVMARRNRQNEKSIELNEWKSGKCINEWMTAGTVNGSSGSSIHLFTFHPATPPQLPQAGASRTLRAHVSEWLNVRVCVGEPSHWENKRLPFLKFNYNRVELIHLLVMRVSLA